jgi:predicted Zn-dependent peptidase
MNIHQTTLPCGARFIAEAMPQMETVAIAISVDVGARWETEAQHGISHLLEHMAFKGTKRFSALQIAEIFDGIGGHFNAFTSHEHTVYYVKVLSEHWQTAADILCDILQDSLFDEDELAREKGVILQELAMHHDTPDDLVFDLYQEAAFGGQALGRSILGTQASIQMHPRAAIVDFVAEHYIAPRMVVSAAGAMDARAVERFFAERLNLPNHANNAPHETASYIGGERITHKDLEQLQLVLGMPSLPTHDERYYALQLLSNMLGGGMSSRLFQEVREKRGLVYTIQSFNASYAETGVFSIYAATAPDQAPELMQVVADELKKACENLREDELQRAKNQQIASLRMARENTSTLAEWMGRHLLQFGEYRDAKMLQHTVESVTLQEVQKLAQELFSAPKLTLAALGPTDGLMNAETFAQTLAA